MADVIKEHVKDPGSAITHFIGMLMAIFAAIPLLIKAAHEPDRIYIISIAVYALSLILLYAASTTYHTFDRSKKVNTILKQFIIIYIVNTFFISVWNNGFNIHNFHLIFSS